jgi:hypothetical protein
MNLFTNDCCFFSFGLAFAVQFKRLFKNFAHHYTRQHLAWQTAQRSLTAPIRFLHITAGK